MAKKTFMYEEEIYMKNLTTETNRKIDQLRQNSHDICKRKPYCITLHRWLARRQGNFYMRT